MDFQHYLDYFESILSDSNAPAPYNDVDYLDYTRLNWARQQRWLKIGVLNEDLAGLISQINQPQQWIIITEPWCGDASHTVPFIHKLTAINPLITADYQLRDAEPFLINEYLTNGGKSIPKLIIRSEAGDDLVNWGPRPRQCQEIYNELTAEKADFNTLKIVLQKWYNADKGESFQRELLDSLR